MNVSATRNETVVHPALAVGARRTAASSEPSGEAIPSIVSTGAGVGAGRVDPDRIARAAAAAEADFQRVKEMVQRTVPQSQYPPLESIERLSSLLGNPTVAVWRLAD